ncbi:MAG: hydantoinase/oxoprolinase family protein [Acetobacteraceae bacterium]|nr:hydantoinase/oxoprolinase family protein [Acetobacteraceae bacterium]
MSLRVGIDIGGTFTDLVAIDLAGRAYTKKVLSTPHDYADAILAGIEALLAETHSTIGEILHATTIGANTVLEGKGARTALITTAGFRDVLEIRDLRMPRLYDLAWTKPPALVERRLRFEVREKIGPDGTVRVPLDPASVTAVIASLRREGVQSLAISLLHSYANPRHEQALAQAVHAELGDLPISLSHEILPEIKEYHRTSTTVINAYVLPVVRAYLASLTDRLSAFGVAAELRLMQSNGGIASVRFAERFPAHIVESGPAAGVVGAAAFASRLDEPRIITFDMGGTTAKAGLVEHAEVLRAEAMEVGGGVVSGARLLVGAGYMLKLPAVDLAEVGAGGGSICRIDAAGAPKVGPESAGADPGPVCYGRGGRSPTITDCSLVLGYLDPAGPAGGALPLDVAAARAAIAGDLARPLGISVEQAAEGMLRIAVATMMRAIRAVTVERGRDPRDFSLLAFGGNGPLFATAIAAELGIGRVIVPPMPGLFSAFGLLLAHTERHQSRSLRARCDAPDHAGADRALAELAREASERLALDGFPPARQAIRRSALARYVGQSTEIPVALPDRLSSGLVRALPELFAQEHERVYGFRAEAGEPVELTGLSIIARGLPERPHAPASIPPVAIATPDARPVWFADQGWIDTQVTDRAALAAGPRTGPLIVQEYDATCLVRAGTTAGLDAYGNLVLSAGSERRGNSPALNGRLG